MAEIDIAPELYNRIKDDFDRMYTKAQLPGNRLNKILKELTDGTATFETAEAYAKEVSGMLTKSICEHLTLEELTATQGKLYFNIAEKVIGQSLEDGYLLVGNVTNNVIEQINKQAGVGIKPIAPKINDWRKKQILNKATECETTTDLRSLIKNSGSQYIRDAVVETEKANAEFASKAGLTVTVTRAYDHVGLRNRTEQCQWCLDRVGTNVPYAEAVKKGMFERHDGCGCFISYKTQKYTTKSNSKKGFS